MIDVIVFMTNRIYISYIKKGGVMKSREYIKAEENFKIEQEKRFQREDRRQQVEQLTLLKDKKKPKGTFPKSK
jgi:hypothetical protein